MYVNFSAINRISLLGAAPAWCAGLLQENGGGRQGRAGWLVACVQKDPQPDPRTPTWYEPNSQFNLEQCQAHAKANRVD